MGGFAYQSEVGEFDLVVAVDQDVVWFDVAVHHPSGVRHRESGEHAAHHSCGGVRGHGAALSEEFAEGTTVDEFHDEEQVVAVFTRVIDVDKAGVRQLRHGSRFPAETVAEDGVINVAIVHDLSCNRSPEAGINTSVDSGHATPRDGCFDAITPIEQITNI